MVWLGGGSHRVLVAAERGERCEVWDAGTRAKGKEQMERRKRLWCLGPRSMQAT